MRRRKFVSRKKRALPPTPPPKREHAGFIELEGVISELLPSAMFRVSMDNGHVILGHLSGKMRLNKIRLLPGDRVSVEVSPYDLTKGRITYRK